MIKKNLAWLISYCIQSVLFIVMMITSIDAIKILTANDLSILAGIVILPIAIALLIASLTYSIVCLIIHICKDSKKLTFVQIACLIIETIIVFTFMFCIL